MAASSWPGTGHAGKTLTGRGFRTGGFIAAYVLDGKWASARV